MSFFAKDPTQLARLRDRTDFSAHLMIWSLAAAHLILAIATQAKANTLLLEDLQEMTSVTPSLVSNGKPLNQILPEVYNLDWP